MTELEKNKKYVDENFESIHSVYRNKYVVVFNQQVDTCFDTFASAARYGVRKYGIDERFLVEFITKIKPLNIVVSAKPKL